MRESERGFARRVLLITSGAMTALMLCAAVAFAHVERTAYWPNPAPDTSVTPPAGGAVPKARSLASALKAKPAGKTRVVCQHGSLWRTKRQIAAAR
jgi:hypothetical protein